MDLQTAFDHGFEVVKSYVDAELGTLVARIAELETRPIEKGDPGASGPPGPEGPPGPKGNSGELVMVPPELAEQVASAVRLLHESPAIAAPRPASAKVTRIERDADGNFVPVYDDQPV